jgi:hypothetical protein
MVGQNQAARRLDTRPRVEWSDHSKRDCHSTGFAATRQGTSSISAQQLDVRRYVILYSLAVLNEPTAIDYFFVEMAEGRSFESNFDSDELSPIQQNVIRGYAEISVKFLDRSFPAIGCLQDGATRTGDAVWSNHWTLQE